MAKIPSELMRSYKENFAINTASDFGKGGNLLISLHPSTSVPETTMTKIAVFVLALILAGKLN